MPKLVCPTMTLWLSHEVATPWKPIYPGLLDELGFFGFPKPVSVVSLVGTPSFHYHQLWNTWYQSNSLNFVYLPSSPKLEYEEDMLGNEISMSFVHQYTVYADTTIILGYHEFIEY